MQSFEQDVSALRHSIAQSILGKDDVIELVVLSLLAQGHLLIEDVPGVGKTTLALALAKSIDGLFQRIQFTSDLLPSDVIGVPIFNQETRAFEFQPGPLFANIVLADEINRTTPKTQSALLEAMQDGHVTVERRTYHLPKPFMVIATQNPIEFHGTYPLPESQLDRFLMRIPMGYPAKEEELKILHTKGNLRGERPIEPVCSANRMSDIQANTTTVRVDPSISEYILRIVSETRTSKDLELGVSPRGALALYRAVQARSFVAGRTYSIPEDVKALAIPVLAHRLIVSSRRSSTPIVQNSHGLAQDILKEILDSVEVPV